MIVPSLRFKCFNEEWKEIKLSDEFIKIKEKNKENAITNVISNSAKYGLVSQNDYFQKDIANSNNTNGYYIIENGDFVYNPRKSQESPYGPINIYNYKEKGIVSPLYLCFKNIGLNNNNFFEYYFKSSKWNRFMYINGDNGVRHDRFSIRDDDFFKMRIKIPCIKEQYKIVDFLSKVDKRIENQNKVIKHLDNTKKGLLQSLFSQESRFNNDEGEKFPEWETKKIKDIADIFLGLTYTPQYVEKGVPFLSCRNLKNGKIDWSNHNFISKEEFDSSTSNAKPQRGDILFGRVGTLGNPVILKDETEFCIFVSLGFLRMKSSKYYNEFVCSWMESDMFKQQIDSKISGSSQKNLNTGWLKEFDIKIPSFEEQQRIAKCISLMNEKIDSEKRILEHWNNIKKGLLQQMFV